MSKRPRTSVAALPELGMASTISSPSSRFLHSTVPPSLLPIPQDTKQQRRNQRSRNRPARVASKLDHAKKKVNENLEELSVRIGRHDGTLEDGTSTLKAKRQGEAGKRKNDPSTIGRNRLYYVRSVCSLSPLSLFSDPTHLSACTCRSHSATCGLSKLGDVLFARAGAAPLGFVDGLNTFARDVLARSDLQRTVNSTNTRSDDVEQLIIGTSRSYSMKSGLIGTFKQYPELVQYILSHSKFQRIVTYVNQLFEVHYPKVYEHYRAANPGPNSNFESLFGVFPLVCFNWSKSCRGATSRMHPDAKNPAGGICCVIPYGHFDSSSSFFLYFKELGKAIELPPGVPIFFPSALFLHGNINRPSVAQAKDENAVFEGRGIPRGSLVFFAQADWLSLAEGMAGTGREDREGEVYTGLSSIFRL
ncbi:hypothetical protein JCM5353_003911 [Sporobolomyces roseus]